MVLGVLSFVFLKLFIFQVYFVPSSSMNSVLHEGDFVFINKLSYGARLPFTPFCFKINNENRYIDFIKLPYVRFFGFSEINRNDIIAFNFSLANQEPIDLQQEYIKRCVAIAGDTIRIKKSCVYVNSKKIFLNTELQQYAIQSNFNLNSNSFVDLNITSIDIQKNEDKYIASLTETQYQKIKLSEKITSIQLIYQEELKFNPSTYPHHPNFLWNNDNLGPIYIPKKGDTIYCSVKNQILLFQTIAKHENLILGYKDSLMTINNKLEKYYVVKHNYFFFLGDNRKNSIDSREWGLIPESHIIGKASFIIHPKLKSI